MVTNDKITSSPGRRRAKLNGRPHQLAALNTYIHTYIHTGMGAFQSGSNWVIQKASKQAMGINLATLVCACILCIIRHGRIEFRV
jgi:low temperature requirement protein LtrA